MNNAPRALKKERKISIVFRRTDQKPLHCAGIQALYLLPEHGSLFSASRDSTIKRWDINTKLPVCTGRFDGHADWVNDLAIYNDLLLSCSNDRTVRIWKAHSSGKLLTTLGHHSDYVTCIAAANHRPIVGSGGLRGEVFLIDVATGTPARLRPKQQQPASRQISQPGMQPATWQGYNSSNGWQNQNHMPDMNGNVSGSGAADTTPAGIYSLAMVPNGNIIAAGSSDHMIRIWDTRTGEKISKLRGHTNNVRCMLLNDDCSMLLSGGADGTMRLWDLSMQRCIQTYVVHSDSVWCLAASPDWSYVYSGGRDQSVFRTRLATRTAELLIHESNPVTDIAINSNNNTVWLSTPSSTIHQWALPRELASPRSAAHAGNRLRMSGGMSSAARKSSMDVKSPSVSHPITTIPGLSAIVSHKVLSDRRHILTRDDPGSVSLWDVLAGREIDRYGKIDLDEKEQALFDARHMPSWFTADNRLGSLCISLEPPHCFSAEDYALSLGYQGAPDDYKLNYGKLVLDCAFAKWRYKLVQAQQGASGSPSNNQQQSAGLPVPPQSNLDPAQPAPQQQQPLQQPASGRLLPHQHQQLQQHLLQQQQQFLQQQQQQPQQPASRQHLPVSLPQQPQTQTQLPQTQEPEGQAVYYNDTWPQYWQGVHPTVICSSAHGIPWQLPISSFSGREKEPEDIPSWVGDVVLRNALVTPRESKCAFVLLPAEGSGLPNLLQSRLNAPRILQVHKVATYCQSRLAEINVQLELRPINLKDKKGSSSNSSSPDSSTHPQQPQQPASQQQVQASKHQLELLCNGVVAPYDMSLSAVKKFIWCKSEDIIFNYRIFDPANPAPLPQIKPGKQ